MTEISYSMPDEFRDLGGESMYEYGSRAGIWRLLGVFDEYDVKTTVLRRRASRSSATPRWAVDAARGPRAVLATAGAGRSSWLLDARGGARAHRPGDRVDRAQTCGRAAARLVLPLRAERATRASCSSRRAASSTTPTPTTTTCPTSSRSRATPAPGRALHAHLQRLALRVRAGLRGALPVRRDGEARPRRAAARGATRATRRCCRSARTRASSGSRGASPACAR